jgi:hypothetical protein
MDPCQGRIGITGTKVGQAVAFCLLDYEKQKTRPGPFIFFW